MTTTLRVNAQELQVSTTAEENAAMRQLTFGNQKHLSSYAMDRLDVGRHPCASTWVRMVIIAPRELGQSSYPPRARKVSSGQVCGDIRAETITKDTSDQLTRRKRR